jgi:hypothetical protein
LKIPRFASPVNPLPDFVCTVWFMGTVCRKGLKASNYEENLAQMVAGPEFVALIKSQ